MKDFKTSGYTLNKFGHGWWLVIIKGERFHFEKKRRAKKFAKKNGEKQ